MSCCFSDGTSEKIIAAGASPVRDPWTTSSPQHAASRGFRRWQLSGCRHEHRRADVPHPCRRDPLPARELPQEVPVAARSHGSPTRSPSWQAAVGTVLLARRLAGLAAVLWDRGWQPADLLRPAGRQKHVARSTSSPCRCTRSHAATATSRADPDWLAQVDAGRAGEWWRRDGPLLPQLAARARLSTCDPPPAVRAQLAGWQLLTTMPPLPILRPPPSQWASTARRAPIARTRSCSRASARYSRRPRRRSSRRRPRR